MLQLFQQRCKTYNITIHNSEKFWNIWKNGPRKITILYACFFWNNLPGASMSSVCSTSTPAQHARKSWASRFRNGCSVAAPSCRVAAGSFWFMSQSSGLWACCAFNCVSRENISEPLASSWACSGFSRSLGSATSSTFSAVLERLAALAGGSASPSLSDST